MIGQANLPSNNVTGGKEGLPRTKKRRHKIKQSPKQARDAPPKGREEEKTERGKRERGELCSYHIVTSAAVVYGRKGPPDKQAPQQKRLT
jgi:hypothetical protein